MKHFFLGSALLGFIALPCYAESLSLRDFDFLGIYRAQNKYVLEVGRRTLREKAEKGLLHPSVVYHWLYIDPDRSNYNSKLKWLNEGPLSKPGFTADARFRDFAGYRLESDSDHALFYNRENAETTELKRVESKHLTPSVKAKIRALVNDFYFRTKRFSFHYDCEVRGHPTEIDVSFVGRYLDEIGFVATTNSPVVVTLQQSNGDRLVIGDEPSGETAKETGGLISGRFQSHQEEVDNVMTLTRQGISAREISRAELFLGKGFEALVLPLAYQQAGEIRYLRGEKTSLNCSRKASEEDLNNWLVNR